MTETLANRRVFRSKVDTIRPTYSFEDVSLAPGTDTVDPADVVLAQDFCGIHLELPVVAAAMDAVADIRLSAELARLGGLARGLARRLLLGVLDLEEGVLHELRLDPVEQVQPRELEDLHRLDHLGRLLESLIHPRALAESESHVNSISGPRAKRPARAS